VSRECTHTRVRGLAPWKTQRKTLARLDEVQAVLDEYRDRLPLTARQLYYRLVGAFDYPKTEKTYERLGEILNRARRAGMVPQLVRVTEPYGVPVLTSGGFNSTTAKLDAACRYADADAPTVVLHVGDHDPSRCAVFDSLEDDMQTMLLGLDAPESVTCVRCAVTPEQIARHRLSDSPVKKTDKRGNWRGGTVQAEALALDQLADEVRRAVLD